MLFANVVSKVYWKFTIHFLGTLVSFLTRIVWLSKIVKKLVLAKFVGAVNMHSFDIVSPESVVGEPEIEVGCDRFVAAKGAV